MRLPAADDADSLLRYHAAVGAKLAGRKDRIGLRAVLINLAFRIDARVPGFRCVQIADSRCNGIADKFYVALAVPRRRLQTAVSMM